jgi:hypothetical protein
MTDSNGNLSVDFMVGFTIFMVAFIWVATLVPNLFLGVSAHGVDFDAVAYRTGVILAEDPGASFIPDSPWEVQPDTAKENVERFGLAVSKETPNILSETKVNRFFNHSAGWLPEDYRNKTIFGDYPYHFNISLTTVTESTYSVPTMYVGEVRPDNYGFMRREVKIKRPSNATIGKSDYVKFKLNNSGMDGNVTSHDFAICINTSHLLTGNVTDPLANPNYHAVYMIDPTKDWINITMEQFNATSPQGPVPDWVNHVGVGGPDSANINLSKITFSQVGYNPAPYLYPLAAGTVPQKDFLYVDGNTMPVSLPVNISYNSVELRNNFTLAFPPGFFIAAQPDGAIYINLTFSVEKELHAGTKDWQGMQYLNTSKSGPWDYNYKTTEVSQPYLTDGVLEVAIW